MLKLLIRWNFRLATLFGLALGFALGGSVVWASLPIPPSERTITQQRTSVHCDNENSRQSQACPAPSAPIKHIVSPDPDDCEAEKPNKQAYNECLLTRYTGELSRYTLALFVATGVLGFVGLGTGILTYRQLRLARDEFVSSHRPEINIRFAIPKGQGLGLPPKSVEIGIVNRGTSAGTMTGCAAQLSFHPSDRVPHPAKVKRNDFIRPRPFAVGSTDSGTIERGNFTQPSQQNLYLSGWIVYEDNAKQPRTTYFCRQYIPEVIFNEDEPAAGSFTKVHDPDFNVID